MTVPVKNSEPLPEAEASDRPKVLIVDDEDFNLDLLAHILESAQFEPIRAKDGLEALQRLEEFGAFEAILLDWMMPNMDGMQLLRKLKEDARYCEIPVIMQTAAGSPQKVREAMDAGAHTYLVKPYAEEAIVNAVKEAQHYTKRKAQW